LSTAATGASLPRGAVGKAIAEGRSQIAEVNPILARNISLLQSDFLLLPSLIAYNLDYGVLLSSQAISDIASEGRASSAS
jgi:hypothetical protein